MSPKYNHTRADGPYNPCPICLKEMSPEEIASWLDDVDDERGAAGNRWLADHGILARMQEPGFRGKMDAAFAAFDDGGTGPLTMPSGRPTVGDGYLRGPQLRPIGEDDGCLMTIAEFWKQSADRSITDDDGFGELATETEVSEIAVVPSQAQRGYGFPDWATHVLWYNK